MKAKVLTNLTHDGVVYTKGQTFEGDKEVVEPLMAEGVLQTPEAAKAEKESVSSDARADAEAEAQKVLAGARKEAADLVAAARKEAEQIKADAAAAAKTEASTGTAGADAKSAKPADDKKTPENK